MRTFRFAIQGFIIGIFFGFWIPGNEPEAMILTSGVVVAACCALISLILTNYAMKIILLFGWFLGTCLFFGTLLKIFISDAHAQDVGFEPYLKAFVLAAKKYQPPLTKPILIGDLIVEFGEMPPSDLPRTQTEGLCIVHEDEMPIIKISEKTWKESTETLREMLLFHELGHCILNREHKETFIKIGSKILPSSLMAPQLFNEKKYLENRDYYLQELFQ